MILSDLLPWLFTASIFSARSSPKPLLRLNQQNELNIAIFSDLHYGEEEDGWGIDQDVNSTRVMQDILTYESPDFVVINGDLITGENTFLQNSSKYVDVIVKDLVDKNVRWASTYGNHDSQFNLSREAVYQEEMKYSLSYTQHSPAGVPGITNYYLPIYPQASSPSSDTPVAILWFFDSLGGAPFQYEPPTDAVQPNWVELATVSWFRSQQAALQQEWGILPSLAFVHIPPGSFLDFQDLDFNPANFPGLNADVPLAQQGDVGDAQDQDFMQALVDTPKLHSVYSGHDHGDAWCGNWLDSVNVTAGVSKPHICFCKHTGYGGYGTWNRGSRILKMGFEGEELTMETWVRMEDGEVVTKVNLNSTYGEDVYPTADGQ